MLRPNTVVIHPSNDERTNERTDSLVVKLITNDGSLLVATNLWQQLWCLNVGVDRRSGTIDTPATFPSCNTQSRGMERAQAGTRNERVASRNVKATSRRPGRKTFLVIHPSSGTGQAKNAR